MHPVSPDTILHQLRWRYATKKFDPARKIDSELWAKLEQAPVLVAVVLWIAAVEVRCRHRP